MSEKKQIIDSVKFDNGKYEIRIIDNGTTVELYRHGELWMIDPLHSKMYIAIVHEVNDLLKACEIAYLALKSYQYGNSSVELAESEVAEFCEKIIAKAKGKSDGC